MSVDVPLLDTPKRISLQTQSSQIRAALKDFERTFAANNEGRKPSKDDIKADIGVAARYKEYNKIRDVLSGKLDPSALNAQIKTTPKKKKHERIDSGVSWTSEKAHDKSKLQKLAESSTSELDDVAQSRSPRPLLLNAIGPTPQRDGRMLGLFDLLSNSTHSSQATPSNRKRKLDALIEQSPMKIGHDTIMQTPSQKRVYARGDILEHLTGTPAQTPETGHRKLSRTPASDGRKFMLSQFFATPSTSRCFKITGNGSHQQTPLRDVILDKNLDPTWQSTNPPPDATPAYLRRSTSFKDRLLSAAEVKEKSDNGVGSLLNTRVGPPTLRHLRSVQKLFDEADENFPNILEEDEDHEDDLEALREMEDSRVNVLVRDSQRFSTADSMPGGSVVTENDHVSTKVWKKKGQKRTTRKAKIRPGRVQHSDAPNFVAAGDDSEDEQDLSQIEETQLSELPPGPKLNKKGNKSEDENYDSRDSDESDQEQTRQKIRKKQPKATTATKDATQKKVPTINPNAVSHMNFRTLKIKNKNSKAKGRGRFGQGRR